MAALPSWPPLKPSTTEVVVWLTKHGADSQALHSTGRTAADMSKRHGTPTEQTAYLEARHTALNPDAVARAGSRSASCLVIFYCSKECQVADWPDHKVECGQSVEKAVAKGR
jgi:hypothetical protein